MSVTLSGAIVLSLWFPIHEMVGGYSSPLKVSTLLSSLGKWKKVGYTVNSRNTAELDVIKYVKPGKNTLTVEVCRHCTGSYLEDQDMC